MSGRPDLAHSRSRLTRQIGFLAAAVLLAGTCRAFAADQPWDSLLARAERFRATNLFDSATAWAESALRVADSVYGPNDTTVARTLIVLALAQVHSDPRIAEKSFRRALSIWEINPAANPRLHARTLNALGILAQREGRYSEADGLFKRSLDIKRATLPPRDNDIAVAYNNQAVLDIEWGRYAEAEWELHKSGEIFLNAPPL